MKEQKRILLVNACLIGDKNGTGFTLDSIFSSIQDEYVYQLCIDFLKDCTDDKHIFYVDKGFSIVRYLLAKRRKNKKQSYAAKQFRWNISGASAVTAKGKIHECLRGIADALPVRISRKMRSFIEQVKPDYIYTCGSSITSLRIARKIAKKYNIPLVLHIMDNWEDTLYRSSLLSRPFSYILKQELIKANRLSSKGLAISQALCDKLSEQYGVPYFPLMNTVDKIEREVSCFQRDILYFTYAGSLSLNRYKSLREIARCLECSLGEQNYLFKLFVPEDQNTSEMQAYFREYNVILNDYIPREQLMQEYANSDVLVLTESFDYNFCVFTKYSLSTKIPEYMAAGKPILAYLNQELYSYSYLKQSQTAFVASDEHQLIDEIKALKDCRIRKEAACRGLDMVKHNNSREYCNKIMKEIFK